MRVELYQSSADLVRGFFEGVLTMAVAGAYTRPLFGST